MHEKETPSSHRSASTEENESHSKESDIVDADLAQQNSADKAEFNQEQPQKRSIWKRLNPFYMTHVPPVPSSDAGLVPEMKSNWFSRLTWGWMGSIMLVHSIFMNEVDFHSSGINGHYRKRIYGITMNRD
jgi:hypothetical protein